MNFRIFLITILTLLYIILNIVFNRKYDKIEVRTITPNNQVNQIDQTRNDKPEKTQPAPVIAEPTIIVTEKNTDIKDRFEFEHNAKKEKLPEIVNPAIENTDETTVFTVVEQNPIYPGGDAARMRFLQKNINYPSEAVKEQIQGKVVINFIIEKDGSVSNVKVLQGIGKGCDEEAIRVVKLMPKWKPGIQSGRPVRVLFNMPINFALGYKK